MDTSTESRTAATLLAQHRALRGLLDAAIECAREKEAPASPRLMELIGRIATEVEEHNRFEEEALEPLLRTIDAWGPERIAQMMGHHREEHIAFVQQLRRLHDTSDPEVALEAIEALASAVRQHMELEEREYLNVRVLRDDIVALDANGG